MAQSTIPYTAPQPTMKMRITFSSESGVENLAAGASKDIATSLSLVGLTVNGYVPIYAGSPKCVITNIWSSNGHANFTVLNPTTIAQTINHTYARVGVLYTK